MLLLWINGRRNKIDEFIAVAQVQCEGEEQREVVIKQCKDCHCPAFHDDVSTVALLKW